MSKTEEFEELIDSIEDGILDEGANMLVRTDEDPPSAVFHASIDGEPYIISVQPLRLAVRVAEDER